MDIDSSNSETKTNCENIGQSYAREIGKLKSTRNRESKKTYCYSMPDAFIQKVQIVEEIACSNVE